MILSFFHLYSLVILLVSLLYSCFRYLYVFINFIGGIFKIIVKRYWIALEIELYKFIIIIIIIIFFPFLSRSRAREEEIPWERSWFKASCVS